MKTPVFILPPGGLSCVPKKERPRYIRALILAANLTTEELARLTRKSNVYINYIINNERTGYTLRPVIAKALGYTVTDLWPDTPQQYREAA